MRRERPKPLLRSALVALGAGGGLMVAGCVLWDAGPASAQTILTANPHAFAPGATHHHLHPVAPRHGHKSGAPTRRGPSTHTSTLARPSATFSSAPTTPAAPTAPTPVAPSVASAGQSPDQAPAAGPRGRPVHGAGRAVHAAGTNAPALVPSQPKGGGKHAAHATTTRTAPKPKPKASHPAAPRSNHRSPSSFVVVPGNGAVRPERLTPLRFGSLDFVPAAAGPRPVPAPTPIRHPIAAGPLPVAALNPFHLPFGIPRTWAGETFSESARLKVPLALLVAMAVFVLVQSLIDRRDPKLSRAPERQGEDSVGFE